MSKKFWHIAEIAIWISVIIVVGLIYYVNHYLPRGTMVPTGDYVCKNDDRGPCGEKYIEDVRDLDIPNWAKFFKKSDGEILLFGLIFAGIVAGVYKNKNSGDS